MTLADIVAVDIPVGHAVDSISFLPQMTGHALSRRQDMMFQGVKDHSRLAFRVGNLKLITDLKRTPQELYDLDVDLGEQNNLLNDPDYADALSNVAVRFAEVYPNLLLR